MKLNLNKDPQPLQRSSMRLGSLTCTPLALHWEIWASVQNCRQEEMPAKPPVDAAKAGEFQDKKIMRVSTCQKHGKVRAVASVHRQAEKDPAMSLADHKFVCVCSFLPGAASLATCWGDAGQKLGRSGEIYG